MKFTKRGNDNLIISVTKSKDTRNNTQDLASQGKVIKIISNFSLVSYIILLRKVRE